MLRRLQSVAVLASIAALGDNGAMAAPCANPKALGVSRTIAVNPLATPFVGSHDYGVRLPLAAGEVVLTFDDGPRPPYTNRVLKALADECLRATFFIVGRQANAHPRLLRQVRAAGHTIGTHTQNHPLLRMRGRHAVGEIEGGIESIAAAIGSRSAIAPFFRFPGLFRTTAAESYLRRRGLMVWSIDVDSYDWKKSGDVEMVKRTVAQLGRRGGGILLLHDSKAKTARVLPMLIAELKRRRFRIVHAVPAVRSQEIPVARTATPPKRKRAAKAPRTSAAAQRASSQHVQPRRAMRPRGNADVVFTSSVPRRR